MKQPNDSLLNFITANPDHPVAKVHQAVVSKEQLVEACDAIRLLIIQEARLIVANPTTQSFTIFGLLTYSFDVASYRLETGQTPPRVYAYVPKDRRLDS